MVNFKTSIESEGTSNNNTSAANNYLRLYDRNSDIIADDIDGPILHDYQCDLSANNFHADVSFGLVHRHVYTHHSAASRRNTLVRPRRRIRSPDDNDNRPHSPDNIYRLNLSE